jgi:hypothetical protein
MVARLQNILEQESTIHTHFYVPPFLFPVGGTIEYLSICGTGYLQKDICAFVYHKSFFDFVLAME